MSVSLYGQFDKVNDAVFYLQNKELDKAKTLIDEAVEDSAVASKTTTQFYRGFIYKELFKKREKDSLFSPYRQEATKSLKKVVLADDKPELTKSSKKILKYLAATHHNQINPLLREGKYELAKKQYSRFESIMKVAAPTEDLTAREVDFKASLGEKYTNLFLTKDDTSKHYLQKAKSIYDEVLKLDSNNFNANYNLAILYYNQGVDIINNMDYDLDLEKLNEIQDKTLDLFLKALPYMKKAYELKPKRKETLIGLSGIYLSLNENEKSKTYREKLEKLKNKEE